MTVVNIGIVTSKANMPTKTANTCYLLMPTKSSRNLKRKNRAYMSLSTTHLF